jgi:predicted RNase H-like HicB family nuclease
MPLSLQHRLALVDSTHGKAAFANSHRTDEDGLYIVSCPLFKGYHSWGETIDEAMNISEVIEMCLEETKIENLNTFVGFRELEVVQDSKASCE